MERIPEPDLMDDAEQAKAYAEADFSEPHEAFVRHFADRFPDFRSGRVLDLGCGPADVIIRFARIFPDTVITGVDGAGAMLDIGAHEIAKRGLGHRIELMKCTLPSPELPRGKFDAVISNSLLHHLSDPMILWKTVQQCSCPGAPVFIMDLLRPDTVESARQLARTYAADAPPVLQKDFFNSLLASYSTDEIHDQLGSLRLGHLKVEAVSDRHVLIWGKSLERPEK